jgi:hypothetical protein
MKKLVFIIFLAVGTNASGQSTTQTARSPTEFVPAGYVVFEEIQGDLNKDNQTDYVFIIKATDRTNFVKDEYRGELDRNRRGIIIAFKNRNQYDLVLENRDCFSSENEDGGVYFAPELSVSINKGNLFVHYAHGRYGFWAYNFRYQNSDFELIGYDSSQNRGPLVEREVSINLITKKMLTRENINQDAEGGDEQFKEIWRKFTLSKPIKLREIANFDDFYVESFLGLVK